MGFSFSRQASRSALAVLATVLCLSADNPAAAQTRPLGIDVSTYQGAMNWATAYSQGVRFAFIRATYGSSTYGNNAGVDAQLAANVPAARKAGVLAGVYHFARPDTICRTDGTQPADSLVLTAAKFEASQFYLRAGSYMKDTYMRPVLDLEARGGTNNTALTPTKLTLWANTFCDEIKRLSGAEPIVYMNSNYAINYVTSALTSRTLWIANYNLTLYGNPTTTGSPPTGVWGSNGKTWSAWQYEAGGDGLGAKYGAKSTDLDIDAYNGTLASLQKNFVIPEPATAGVLAVGCGLALLRRRRPLAA